MNTDSDLHDLLGAYLLDSLPEEETRAFESHLEGCRACRTELAELGDARTVVAPPAIDPPAGLRERIVQQARNLPQEPPIREEPAPTPRPGVEPHRPTSPWFLRVTAVAASILLLAVGGLALALLDVNERLQDTRATAEATAELLAAPDLIVATAEGDDGASGRVLASASRQESLVAVDRLAPAPRDRTYQLWVIEDGEASSAGLFDTDGDGRATRALEVAPSDAAVIGITLEPAGGSPQPTTDPVLAIELP